MEHTDANKSKPLFGEEYHENFDPDEHLAKKFAGEVLEWHPEVFKSFHSFFQSAFSASAIGRLKILDYGTGATLAYQISASQYASELVLAEYTEKNRTALRLWLNRDAKAHNWTPYFRYVVEVVEGKSEREAVEREKHLQKVVKAVVPCDITKDVIVEKGYEGPYDVIVCCLCLSAACATKDEYRAAVSKLLSLLVPGGKIVLLCAHAQGQDSQSEASYYPVGSANFRFLVTSEEFIAASLQQAGFLDIVTKRLLHGLSSAIGLVFVTASTPE